MARVTKKQLSKDIELVKKLLGDDKIKNSERVRAHLENFERELLNENYELGRIQKKGGE